jgi:hypothetical protein
MTPLLKKGEGKARAEDIASGMVKFQIGCASGRK